MDNLSSLHQEAESLDSQTVKLFQPKDQIRYRYRSNSGSEFIDYPLPAATIEYYLPKGVQGPIKMEFLNAAGQVVRTLIGGKQAQESQVVRDMATNQVEYSLNNRLSKEPGLHRFEWDMRHSGAWDASPRRRYSGGPMVSPGVYTVRLTVDEQVFEQQFELQIDPKVASSGVTVADLQEQESTALAIVALLSEVKQLRQNVQQAQQKLEKRQDLSAAEQERLTQLQAATEQLVRAEGSYTQPMLVDQVNYLYGIVRRADQRPGKDVQERLEVLRMQANKLAQTLD
jgi:hypothetical protein